MAVAVALLMIGGEFDLSAGMMTGATGILVGLMAKYFTGDGAPMWLAHRRGVPPRRHGRVLQRHTRQRTGLPSFIVTLATFFVLKGVTLVFAKRLEGKVNVSDIKDAEWHQPVRALVLAGVQTEELHRARRQVLSLVLAGAVCLIMGLCEQSFVRRTSRASHRGRVRSAVGAFGVVLPSLRS